VGDLVPVALENNYTTLIIADHGNSEMMINADGSPNTAHTTNPVPIIVVDPDIKSVKNGILANIAPTVLKILDIEKPFIMTEESLI
jgi:2,3-bisphosphoglycerate-independent phosphoglycerate mutase